MLRPRLIPVILVDDQLHMVKTTRFQDRHYLGDPLNAAYVFSGFEVDELIVLDIDASPSGRGIPINFVQALARFTTVPLTVGGGLRSLDQIAEVLALGVEKVVLCSALAHDLRFLRDAAAAFGSSTIVACLNTLRTLSGDHRVVERDGRSLIANSAHDFALACQDAGAGEILVNSIDRDGQRCGYAIDLLCELNDRLSIPLVGLGGAGSDEHVAELLTATRIGGAAAGSLYAYAPGGRQVLLNYPQRT